MLAGLILGIVLCIAVSLWFKSQGAGNGTGQSRVASDETPSLAAANAELKTKLAEFERLALKVELQAEIARWRYGITVDDPADPHSVVPPGHRVIDLAAELGAIAKGASDPATSDALWDAAGAYDTVHEAQLAEIDRYAKAVDGFLAGAVDAAVASYLRGQVLEHFQKLASAYKTFSAVYREGQTKHGAALAAKHGR